MSNMDLRLTLFLAVLFASSSTVYKSSFGPKYTIQCYWLTEPTPELNKPIINQNNSPCNVPEMALVEQTNNNAVTPYQVISILKSVM